VSIHHPFYFPHPLTKFQLLLSQLHHPSLPAILESLIRPVLQTPSSNMHGSCKQYLPVTRASLADLRPKKVIFHQYSLPHDCGNHPSRQHLIHACHSVEEHTNRELPSGSYSRIARHEGKLYLRWAISAHHPEPGPQMVSRRPSTRQRSPRRNIPRPSNLKHIHKPPKPPKFVSHRPETRDGNKRHQIRHSLQRSQALRPRSPPNGTSNTPKPQQHKRHKHAPTARPILESLRHLRRCAARDTARKQPLEHTYGYHECPRLGHQWGLAAVESGWLYDGCG